MAALLVPILALILATAAVAPDRPTATIEFSRAVSNIEYITDRLSDRPPGSVHRAPEASPEESLATLYGWIGRRLPEDVEAQRTDHFVPFAVQYTGGVAARAWCDTNFNGDLADDPPLKLWSYPGAEGTRSFLAELRWLSRLDEREAPVERTFRVVLEPGAPAEEDGPRYRVQIVHAMMGEIVLEGRPHRAFLFDGNGDGFYTHDRLDGLFVDLDDDGHIVVDQMLPEFGSFNVPFAMGSISYEVTTVDPEGRTIELREIGAAEAPQPPPTLGQPAPDFSFVDSDGRRRRLSDLRGGYALVYFWASWCRTCADQAAPITSLYRRYHARGLEILGVSYDIDRQAMERFRTEHGQTWPSSYSGRQVWEDPIGRLYRERGSGVFYLIDPSGTLQGTYARVEDLESRLADLMAHAAEGEPPTPPPAIMP